MMKIFRCALLSALILGWCANVAPVLAQNKTAPARTVEDNAGFFSAQARKQANAEIAEIKRQYHKDLFIQTFNVPRAGFDKVDIKDKEARSRFFHDWANDQARNSGITGVYVLVFKDPSNPKQWWIQPMVGPGTLKSGRFTQANRDELGKRFQARFAKDPDAALTDAVAYVHETLRTNTPAAGAVTPPAAAPTGEGMSPLVGYVCAGVVVLLVVWLVIAVIRAMSGGGAAAGSPAAGGGFLSSLLGGLLGAAAGMWLYNSMFGSHTPSVGADPGSMSAGDADSSDAGQDFSGGGGGGGDWGDTGGDAGGGDFGGGGGGDFGGGGGGDW